MTLTKISEKEWNQATTRLPGSWSKRDRERTNTRRNNHSIVRSVCVDGEGYSLPDGSHIYTYMAASNSDGSFVSDRYSPSVDGLTTEECFWFLANLPRTYRKIAFSFDYDVNMMLKDLNFFQLSHLHEKGFVRWNGWTINWTPHKMFSIKRPKNHKHGKLTCTIWDIFGYFQKSFVKTIWEWQVGTEEELRLIANMKERRSEFTDAEIAEISFYCKLECKLGSQVFDKLLACTKAVGLNLTRYDGAGSVAAAMLRKHDVKQYMHQTLRIPDEVICAGYYGGRFDLSTFGECGDAIQYDINSAYPYQAMSLPCLSCGFWEYSKVYQPNARWAIWDTSWSIDKSNLWSPFPYRHNGHIFYVLNGSGWYWADELREAINLYPDSVQVRKGYVFNATCNHKPFSFIFDYFQRRRRLKEEGDLAQIVLKLGLNAMYGKLAQNVGRGIPQTQCLIWAGIITSNTRAMLLNAIQRDKRALLVATDAIITSESIQLATGDNLGEWERSYLQNLFIITNGVYQARGAKEDKHATRGVSLKDLYDPANKIDHWSVIRREAARNNAFTYRISTRRFVGLGRSLSANPVLYDWRTWKLEDHNINYGKFDYKEQRDGRLYPILNPWGEQPSQPFDPKVYRQDDVPLLDGLGLNLLESMERE